MQRFSYKNANSFSFLASIKYSGLKKLPKYLAEEIIKQAEFDEFGRYDLKSYSDKLNSKDRKFIKLLVCDPVYGNKQLFVPFFCDKNELAQLKTMNSYNSSLCESDFRSAWYQNRKDSNQLYKLDLWHMSGTKDGYHGRSGLWGTSTKHNHYHAAVIGIDLKELEENLSFSENNQDWQWKNESILKNINDYFSYFEDARSRCEDEKQKPIVLVVFCNANPSNMKVKNSVTNIAIKCINEKMQDCDFHTLFSEDLFEEGAGFIVDKLIELVENNRKEDIVPQNEKSFCAMF